MIDEISSVKDQIKAPEFDKRYKADEAIVRAELTLLPNSKHLTVVFPPWHIPEWFLKHLKKRLLAKGSGVLIYNFNPQILDDDVVKVKNSFEYIALSISTDLAELKAKGRIDQVDLLGLSLGNVALAITAEKLADFQKVLMIAPGSDLAGSLWHGWRTIRLRRTLEKEGYKLEDLKTEWDDLAPDRHVQTLRGHNLHIVLAKNDRFIPYEYGKQLLDELLAIDPKVTYSQRPFGHLATILSYDY